MTIENAQAAKAEKHLSKLIRTSDFGVTTRKERLVRALKSGYQLSVALVPDEARECTIQAELDRMNGSWDWVPTGNEKHPRTIKYRSLQKELADGPKRNSYRLHDTHDTFYELTKTEWDYANSIASVDDVQVAAE